MTELYKFHMDITSVGYEHPGLKCSSVLARCTLTYPRLSAPLHQKCVPSNRPVVVVMGEHKQYP